MMFLAMIVCSAVCGVAAAWDWRTGKIPNWLTLGALGCGIVAHAAYAAYALGWSAGVHQGLLSLAGALLCAAAPAVFFFRGSMGGGDVKLFAAIGALCHPILGLETEMYGLVIASLVAPVRLAAEGRLLRTLGLSVALVANPFLPSARRRSVPEGAMTWFRLGPSIFAGSLITLAVHGFARLAP